MKKLAKLCFALVGGVVTFILALVLPVLLKTASVVLPAAGRVSDWMIQATFAQTAPQSIAEMSTEVTGFANTIMPAWLVYVVFALIAALGIWIISRSVSSMKRG